MGIVKIRGKRKVWKTLIYIAAIFAVLFVAFATYIGYLVVTSPSGEVPEAIWASCDYYCPTLPEVDSYSAFYDWDTDEYLCECYDVSKNILESFSYIIEDEEVLCTNCGEEPVRAFSSNRSLFDQYPYEKELKNEDFRLVCVKDCIASEERFNEAYDDLLKLTTLLKEVTETNVHQGLHPFEAHATRDHICTLESGINIAYASSMVDGVGIERGLMCLKTNEIASDEVVLHELTHLFQFNRFPAGDAPSDMILEGHAEIMGSLAFPSNTNQSFCWAGNSPEAHKDEAEYRLYQKGRELFYELCTDYDFDVDDMPELFRVLEEEPLTNAADFVYVVNDIVGKDTRSAFERAGFFEVQYTETGIHWGSK